MNKKMLVIGVWVLALFSVIPTVAAQDDSPEALMRQRELIEAGNAAYLRGDFPQALQSYVGAYAQNPNPELGYRIGQTHEKMGNYKAARESFARYLEQTPQTRYADRIKAHIEYLRELELKAQPMLTLKSEPSMARVWINGQRQPELTPFSFALGAGTYRIKLELPMHSSVEDEVTLETGQQIEREYRLEPEAKPEPEPQPEPEPEPEPAPEPEPEPAPEPKPEPERPLTVVNIAPPAVVSVLSWNMVAVGTAVLGFGVAIWSFEGVDEVSTGMVLSGAALMAGGGYLLFVKDWSADYEDRGFSVINAKASRPARAIGPGLRFEF